MKYYTKKPRGYRRRKIPSMLMIIIAIVVIFNSFLVLFQKRIFPTALSVAEKIMESEAIKIINEETMRIYSEDFTYDDIMRVEKDSDGNISMIRSDTVKQNELTAKVVLACNKKLEELGELGAEVPIGYVTNNAFFYQLGPEIEVKMQQIGTINTSYDSTFESAGINQVRHKVYLKVAAKMRLIVPLNSKDIDVTCQIPIAETIIVGKIPDTSINLQK